MSDDPIFLIASAAYVDIELAAEFGKLPPAFLPVGNSRLYEFQIDSVTHLPGRRCLSVPESFMIPAWDLRRLGELGVDIVRVPDGLGLGASISTALALAGNGQGAVRILHGDTVIYDLENSEADVVAVGRAESGYDWGVLGSSGLGGASLGTDADDQSILAGYFGFSDSIALRRALARGREDFLAAVDLYRAEVCMKAINVESWLDFGHIQTFYSSRCEIRTQRAFNNLHIDFQTVTKSSFDTNKMNQEASWFESIPSSLRIFVPSYLGRRQPNGFDGYAVEYLPTPSLHEMFVFGDLDLKVWRSIMGSCFSFIKACQDFKSEDARPDIINDLVKNKTHTRLSLFADQNEFDENRCLSFNGAPTPSLRDIANITSDMIEPSSSETIGIMHGDFCFTNLFFDHRRQQIRCIDPRGAVVSGQPSIYGDVRYDLAKLNHSAHGFYDLILAGQYQCREQSSDYQIEFPEDGRFHRAMSAAEGFSVAGHTLGDLQVSAITIHLFLSMLPLHQDRPDRQRAFVANILRLFASLENRL